MSLFKICERNVLIQKQHFLLTPLPCVYAMVNKTALARVYADAVWPLFCASHCALKIKRSDLSAELEALQHAIPQVRLFDC